MENKTLEDSISMAMECTNDNLIKYLPYILQDFWELGSSPQEIIDIIKKYKQEYKNLKILDLGSGKGAVSVKISLELGCSCFGIDAIEDFVIYSNQKSKEYSLENICVFEKNDIRARIKTLGKYDVIILGAIGPVFGNYYNTVSQLSPYLNYGGLIIICDAYIEDGFKTDYPGVFQKKDILEQINNAGMKILEEKTNFEAAQIESEYENEYNNLNKRCMELIEKYPEDKELFIEYSERQKEFYWKLSNEVTGVIFVLQGK